MEKQPFTPNGIQAKQTELYALPTAQFNAEIKLIVDNFKSWLINNFSFDSNQLTYVSGMDDDFLDSVALQSALCLKNKLPITLGATSNKPGKRIKTSSSVIGNYDPNEGWSFSGDMVVEEV